MCLAIPAKIEEIENDIGIVNVSGIRRKVSLQLLEGAKVGEYVIVHAGFAIQQMNVSEAKDTLDLLNEAFPMLDEKS